MSDIDDLRARKKRLEEELSYVMERLRAALVRDYPYKPGNILRATFIPFSFSGGNNPVSVVGKVMEVYSPRAEVAVMSVAMRLKGGAFSTSREWKITGNAKIEKLADSEADLAQKEAK